MTEIQTLIRSATRRLTVARFLETLAGGAVLGLAALMVWALATKAVPALGTPWWIPASVAAGVVLVIAVARALGPGRDQVSVAVAIDQRLGLDDRLSTAVQIADRDDPFAVAAIADAAAAARRPDVPGRVAEAFRPAPPRGWWVSPMLLLFVVGVWTIVPQGDLFGSVPSENDAVLAETNQQVDSEVEELIAIIDENEMLAAEMEGTLDELMGGLENGEEPEEPQTPEEVKREAIRQVTALQDRLQEILDGEDARMDATLRESLADLKNDGSGDADADELAEALAKGDFKQAKEAFDRLAERMESGDMSAEEAEALKAALEDLAKQLQEAADKKKDLEDALKNAGLDPDLAKNPEAMKQAIQNASNLNESQKQALQEAAAAQQQASQAMQQMSQAMQQMAQGDQQGQKQGEQMLSEMERMQQMLQQAQAASGQCQGACDKMGQGLSQWAQNLAQGQSQSAGQGQGQGQGQGKGQGMGGPGQGQGGQAPIAPTPTGTRMQREKVEKRDGDIIAREMIEGEPVVGESKARLQRISDRIERGFEEGLREDPIPPHLRDVHQHYFGELKKRIDAVPKGAPEKAPAAPPAEPAKETAPEGA